MKVVRVLHRRKSKAVVSKYNDLMKSWREQDARISMIQMLIPLGLKAVEEELQWEVKRLVGGDRHERTGSGLKRWGVNPGSVYLGDQKLAIEVPRVRDVEKREEVPLSSYRAFQNPQTINDQVLKHVMLGMSQGHYEEAAITVPSTFGIKKSSVSRRFIRATAKELKRLMDRDLSGEEIISIFMDGKKFGENQIVIALGVTLTGKKLVLGFIETATENGSVCRDFLKRLIERGLKTEHEILFVIDGAKGLRSGIEEVFGEKAVVQRCQWHKRENVVEYLGKGRKEETRKKLQQAYEQPTYEKARSQLLSIRRELSLINKDAASSLEEGLEETLTLHRLGMFSKLGVSFKTTNCIETVNHQLGIYTDRVDAWRNSDQRQRWVGTALLKIEPRMRRVKGHAHLRELREAMQEFRNQNQLKAA